MSSPYDHGILGGPPRAPERCPITGRPYEDGHRALSHAEQTKLFIREAAIAADKPISKEFVINGGSHETLPRCPQTGREYECGVGALSKTLQTAQFLNELTDEQKAQRSADFEMLRDVATKGNA